MNARALKILAASQKARRHLIPILATLLLLTLCGNTARATVITCTNSGNWSVAANWSPNSVPGPGDSVYITNYTVTLNISTSVAGLALTGGTLGGASSLAINGPFVWSGGSVANTGWMTLNGTSSLEGVGSGSMFCGGHLINAGALTWSGSGNNLDFNNSGILTNLASGTITIAADVSSEVGGIIANAGLITKTNTTGTTTLTGTFVNTGTLNVQSGTVILNANSTQAGVVNIASGSTLYFTGGTHAVVAGFSAPGPGSLIINGGAVNFNNAAGSAVPNLTLTAGTLSGTGLLAVNGPFVWSGGSVANTGWMTLNGTSSLEGVGSGSMFCGGHLINAGALTWSGSGNNLDFNNSGILTNLASGTITIAADVSSEVGGIVVNAGLITQTNTTGTTTLTGTFVNTGTLNLQSGTVDLTGTFTLGGGILSFGINGATNYGKLNLSSGTSAQRRLAVNLNGFYWPTVGSAFNLLTYTSESGAFFTNTALPPFITWQTNYNPTVFTLTVVARQTNTAPTNITMSRAGDTGVNLAWPGDHTGWQLGAQTNSLQVGLGSNWVIVPGSGSTNEMTFPIDLVNGAVFFRLMYP